MIRGTLREVASVLRGELTGEDRSFLGVSTDSRTLEAGQLFVALVGPNFDGHDFLNAAADRGAAGAVVSVARNGDLPCVRVPDTLNALGALAAHWRSRFDPVVVGVTGSAGKTTVKEMIAAILSRGGPVLVTRGNLNNEIGVPLTLFRLSATHRGAVIEMGANHAGEIGRLAEMARPGVGVITLAGAAHLEGFGSVAGVARAKAELFEALPSDGTAVINADDCYARLWREIASPRSVVTFGLGPGSDFTARNIRAAGEGNTGSDFRLACPVGEIDAHIGLPGLHNVMNALAAAAAAIAAGATLEDVAAGLANTAPVSGRMQIRAGQAGSRIIDDTYNANPGAVRVALDYLADLDGRPWAILGDMGELGEHSGRLHREVGEYARSVGVEKLYVIGPLARQIAEGFGAGAESFADVHSLLVAVRPGLDQQVNVLVKGSRSMGMERVVQGLVAQDEARVASGGGS
jgi:UDP-N-acetylmuramoyl-tripeptide--D-alanyl-D-alanine ligase